MRLKFLKTFLQACLLVLTYIVLSESLSESLLCQFNPVEFVKDTLDNGLQVIYNYDNSAPVIATVIHYRVGSRDEEPGKTGYAHFFEHLMFEATDDIPRASIDKYVQEAGGTLNAHTSFDETVFYFQLPANQIKLALWIESQRMRRLHVDSIGVETQRGVVLEELKSRTLNQPYGTLMMKTCEHIFKNSKYEWQVIGSPEHIKKATIQDFKNFYDKFYRPDNATLVISGDFDLELTRSYVKSYFGQYKKNSNPINNQSFEVKEVSEAWRETLEDEKAQLAGIFITYKAPKLGEKDYYAMKLLLEILSSGESSRLYRRLVDKDQIASQASVMGMMLEYGGMAMFRGLAAPGKKLEDVESAINDELNILLKSGVTDDEFKKAQSMTEAGFVRGKKKVLEKAEGLARYNSYFGNPGIINTELDNYMNLNVSDLNEVARKYFQTDKKVVLIYNPKNSK